MIASWLAARSYRRLLSACHTPLMAQAARLRQTLTRAAHTEFGQAHEFARLVHNTDPEALIRAFQSRVPVRSYQEMRTDLDAVYAGHWRTLCPSRPVYFSMTAGSTGQFKYLPVTAEFRKDVGRGSLAFQGALEASCPALGRQQIQFLVGSAEGGRSPSGIPQGFASGFNYKNLPRVVRNKFVLPYWIFTLSDVDDRNYAAGRILVDHPRLGALCAISPVNLINLRQALETYAERLFADLAAGSLTLRGASAVQGIYRGRRNPALAARLRDAWRRDGVLPQRLLFPSLDVLICWRGGNMSYYLNELDQRFGPTQQFEFPISASEGFFAVPHRLNETGGILAITSHFLEFIPEDGTADSGGMALRADQLEIGGHYRLVVTNSSGLYRYDMEDVVRVTSFVHRTPVIAFVSRTGRQVSVANERVTELDVTLAMQAASRVADLWFHEFLFVPCSDKRYRVCLDGTAVGGVPGRDEDTRLQVFAEELERQLRDAAKGYDFERDDALLKPLELVVTSPGELKRYLDRRSNPHQLPNAQVKPMHLTNEFDAHRGFSGLRTYAT